MVSKAKLYSRLDFLEAQLKTLLVPHLREAAIGENDQVFCVTQFNPFRELKSHTDKLTEELVEMGAAALALREKLGEPTEGTIAARICWYCRQWGSTHNHHRPTASGLARQFLAEIETPNKLD